EHDRGGEAGRAKNWLPSNDRGSVPPPGGERPLQCRFCVPYFVCEGGSVDRGNRRRPARPLVVPGGRAKWVPAKPRISHGRRLRDASSCLDSFGGKHHPLPTLPHHGGGLLPGFGPQHKTFPFEEQI